MKKNTVRIIAGKWRGRRVDFPDLPTLRPTPDRIRETLFNWLTPYLQDSHCLDLFAGSGAIGFEAISRGASAVVMVDQEKTVIAALSEQAQKLRAENLSILQLNIPDEAIPVAEPFDIVFLDPPFGKNLLLPCFEYLQQNNLLASSALIYVETELDEEKLTLPENWSITKAKKAGNVWFCLIQATPLVLT